MATKKKAAKKKAGKKKAGKNVAVAVRLRWNPRVTGDPPPPDVWNVLDPRAQRLLADYISKVIERGRR
jgi:hypothetical protein